MQRNLWFLKTSDLMFIWFGCFEDIHLKTWLWPESFRRKRSRSGGRLQLDGKQRTLRSSRLAKENGTVRFLENVHLKSKKIYIYLCQSTSKSCIISLHFTTLFRSSLGLITAVVIASRWRGIWRGLCLEVRWFLQSSTGKKRRCLNLWPLGWMMAEAKHQVWLRVHHRASVPHRFILCQQEALRAGEIDVSPVTAVHKAALHSQTLLYHIKTPAPGFNFETCSAHVYSMKSVNGGQYWYCGGPPQINQCMGNTLHIWSSWWIIRLKICSVILSFYLSMLITVVILNILCKE